MNIECKGWIETDDGHWMRDNGNNEYEMVQMTCVNLTEKDRAAGEHEYVICHMWSSGCSIGEADSYDEAAKIAEKWMEEH